MTIDNLEVLTPREYMTMQLAAKGLENKQIADTMWIKCCTVAAYLNKVYRKLGIKQRHQLPYYLKNNKVSIVCSGIYGSKHEEAYIELIEKYKDVNVQQIAARLGCGVHTIRALQKKLDKKAHHN